jgi:hypothetical protein
MRGRLDVLDGAGTRSAATAASFFVLMGALSSLLIPNPPRQSRGALRRKAAPASEDAELVQDAAH